MIEIDLYTTDGRYVVTVRVPDFDLEREVIVHGSKVYRRDPDLARHFREVAAYFTVPVPGSAEVRR